MTSQRRRQRNESQRKPDRWMPVFVVVSGLPTVIASVDNPKKRVSETAAGEYLQRVGTATIGDGGEIAIDLFATPVSGRLLLRKPGAGEKRQPWNGD
jgi:hypothetical protein